MSVVRLQAVLWRKINDSSYKTLDGTFKGQYEIRLGNPDGIGDFFSALPEEDSTDDGGFTKRVPLSALAGDPNVPPFTIDIAKRGRESERKDWNISRQQSTPYPLWQLSRLGNPSKADVVDKCYLIICKDTDGRYHARWLTPSDVASLPDELKDALSKSDVGTHVFSSEDPEVLDILRNLRSNLNVLLYGPPATGKTYLINEVVRAFNRSIVLNTSYERDAIYAADRNTRVAFVTFHQSYTYEEFMVALMPSDRLSHSLLSLHPRPGVLLDLARFAIEPGNEALLVIDEINRGNVSRIFGEFITVMERAKRLGEDGKVTPTTVLFRLPYYDGDFALPLRLYTLATMNSVDHSVAPLDAALRRRFDTVEIMPNLDQLAQQLEARGWRSGTIALPLTDAQSYKVLALRLLGYLNGKIAHFRGTEYQMGQWYFDSLVAVRSDPAALRDALHEAWWKRILPQLEELFAGQVEQLTHILDLRESPRDPMFVQQADTSDEDRGARAVFRKSSKPELLDSYFVRLIGRSESTEDGPSVLPADDTQDDVTATANQVEDPPADPTPA